MEHQSNLDEQLKPPGQDDTRAVRRPSGRRPDKSKRSKS